mmetsp:Transcript_137152/g.292963  ORF Transcript_137152/g.292963 Transcript_137152/m.292963 type:complete len:214 (+) Transcript_137152:870-1511(+)
MWAGDIRVVDFLHFAVRLLDLRRLSSTWDLEELVEIARRRRRLCVGDRSAGGVIAEAQTGDAGTPRPGLSTSGCSVCSGTGSEGCRNGEALHHCRRSPCRPACRRQRERCTPCGCSSGKLRWTARPSEGRWRGPSGTLRLDSCEKVRWRPGAQEAACNGRSAQCASAAAGSSVGGCVGRCCQHHVGRPRSPTNPTRHKPRPGPMLEAAGERKC